MLEMLRNFTSGWTAKLLLGLLIASFALWGVSGSLLQGTNDVVKVGDTEVDTFQFRSAYESQLAQWTEQFKRPLSRKEANSIGLEDLVLTQVVTGAVLDEQSGKMKLGLSEKKLAEEISNDPIFKDYTGKFSADRYRSYLRQPGVTEKSFLDRRLRVATRQQIQDGTSAGLKTPQVFLDAVALYDNQTRIFDYAIVGAEDIDRLTNPSEEELKTYFEANKAAFTAPEYRKFIYLALTPKDLIKPQEVSEEDLQKSYDSRKKSLITPERRKIEQLSLKNETEAAEVQKKIAAGTSFDKILEEMGKTSKDIELGILKQDELPDAAIAKAAFEAELNKPTASVKGAFGQVILRVSEIQPEKTTPFEEIKDKLRDELALQRAKDEVFNLFDKIEDERTSGALVKEAAQTLGLQIKTITAIDAQGLDKQGNAVTDIPSTTEVLAQIFQTEAGFDADAIQIGGDGYLWFDVEEVTPTRQKTLDEVKYDAQKAWIAEETSKKVKVLAEKIAKEVKDGADFNTILETSLKPDSLGQNIKFKTSEGLVRTATHADVDRQALTKGFEGLEGDVEAIPLLNKDHIILRVAKIEQDGEHKASKETAEQLNEGFSLDLFQQLVEDMQSREEVSINRSAIEIAFLRR